MPCSGSNALGKRDRKRTVCSGWRRLRVDGKACLAGSDQAIIGRKNTKWSTLFLAPALIPTSTMAVITWCKICGTHKSLGQSAWLARGDAISIEDAPRTDFNGSELLHRWLHQRVIWLSGAPISLLETRSLDWDNPPYQTMRQTAHFPPGAHISATQGVVCGIVANSGLCISTAIFTSLCRGLPGPCPNPGKEKAFA